MTQRGSQRLTMAGVDRVWRGNAVIATVGPMTPPPRGDIVRALTTLAAAGPGARVGLRFDPHSPAHWRYDPAGLADWLDDCVRQLPGDDGDLDALLTGIPHPRSIDRPMQVHLADRHVVVQLDHSLGDSRLAIGLPALLASIARGGELPRWATMPQERNPLATAVRRTFHSWGAVSAVLSDRASAHAEQVALHTGTSAEQPFVPDPVAVSEMGPVGGPRRMQTWAAAHASASAPFATVLTCVHRALLEEGIECRPGVHMVYDLRRYLPRDHHVTGNFVSGIELAMPLNDPAAVTAAVTAAGTTGRPLAALTATVLRGNVIRRRPPEPTTRPVVPHAELAFSYLGQQAFDESLPWLGDPGDRRYWSRVTPASPTAITVLVAITERRLTLNTSFHASVFDPAAVRRALRRVGEDPEGLLDRSLAER